MKRIISVVLMLVLAFSLTACGDKEVGGTLAESQATPAATPAPPSAPETVEPETTVEPDEASEELEIGNQVGGRYENSFFGIGCELDENWTYLTPDELAALIGKTSDIFDDEELAKNFESIDMFYDMAAQADDGLVSINVIVQNLGLLYGIALDEEQVIDLSFDQIDAQMESAGFTIVAKEKQNIEFAGEERVCLKLDCDVQGNAYYALQVYIKEGNYLAMITFSCFLEDITSELSNNFFAVE